MMSISNLNSTEVTMNIKLNTRDRLSSYFKYHVLARIKVGPAPRNAQEVQHLHDSFKTIGNVEYFHIGLGKPIYNLYSPYIYVVFNPSMEKSQLRPMIYEEIAEPVPESVDNILMNQENLVQDLKSLIAIPRFSYFHNDKKYINGEIEIQYKHRLVGKSLQYDGRYSITPATVHLPFHKILLLDTKVNPISLVYDMRSNFQKFHKFDQVSVWTGVEALNKFMKKERLNNGITQDEFIGQ